MDVLAMLQQEDDNPRGRGVAAESSGRVHRDAASLDAAAAAEDQRKANKSLKLSLREQEAGILHLMTARSIFARLRVPEPSWDEAGRPVWQVPGERFLQRAYDELKLCCHPDFSAHPRRREGLAKLTEAYETLSDRNGTRDEVVAAFVAEGVERERRMAAAGPSAGAVADSAASMAESMAARMRQKLADQKMAARKQAGTGGRRGGTASPPEGLSAGPARAPTPRGVAEAGGSESEDEATREARRVARRGAAQQAGRKKRRVGAL